MQLILLLYMVVFLFLLSVQPFQMVSLVISMVICMLMLFHNMHFFHWTCYMILMVYLGGLLILFLYFTSISDFSISISPYKILIISLFFFLLKPFLMMKNTGFSKACLSGVFTFSLNEMSFILISICWLMLFILVFMSALPSISSPMRQN